ncbi:DUF1330 domain-containing protein [Alphaproteobacteria bacterium]|nr:DUF1330 domain-containing protein [Alphaproteobacteria bacterium]
MKKGYVVLQVDVKDPEIFKEYPQLSEKIISKFGGKYLFRGGDFDIREGNWKYKRNVLLEFESVDKANEWYNSSDYQEALKIRSKSTSSNLIIIEGY